MNKSGAVVVVLLVFVFGEVVQGSSSQDGPESRIIDGTPVNPGDFPFIAQIGFTNFTHQCTAVIYNERWLVTAASCVHGKRPIELVVTVGQVSLITVEADEKTFLISSIKEHPSYDSSTKLNDLALVQVAETITFGPNVRSAFFRQLDLSETSGIVVGWGHTDGAGMTTTRLRQGNVTLTGNCTAYGSSYNPNFMICAGAEGDNSPCSQDEGSPLIQGNRWVVGIVSNNKGTCGAAPYTSTVYARVPYYGQWMTQIAGTQPPSGAVPVYAIGI